MAQTIKHVKVSGVPDGTDLNQVQPTDWNADHAITGSIDYSEITNKPTSFPATSASTTEVLTGTDVAKAVTPDALAALWERGVDVASAATVAFGEGGVFTITGNITITDIDFATPKDGRVAFVRFTGTPLLTHGANLTLPGAANLQATAGDTAVFVQNNGDAVVCWTYTRADGTPVIKASTTEILTGTDANKSVTPDALAALWERGTNTVAAATLVLGEGAYFVITGSTTIADIDFAVPKDGRGAWLYFFNTVTLTHSANLMLPTGANITAVLGDVGYFVQHSVDIIYCLGFWRASGKAVVPPTAAEVPFTPTGTVVATDVQAAIAEIAAEITPYAGMRNRIINGDFSIDQRNNGVAVPIAAGAGAIYTLDRWRVASNQAPGALSAQRNIDSDGEYNMLVAVATADTSLGSTDVYYVGQTIEGSFSRDFYWGSAQAKDITISFEINCAITATLPLSIRNAAVNRTWLGSFSVPVANTWTKIVMTVPGDTTGTWAKDNTAGLVIQIGLGTGSSRQGVAGWQAGDLLTLAGMTNIMATAGTNFLYLRKFQLEIGTVATEFERASPTQRILQCQRYYEEGSSGGPSIFSGNATSGAVYFAVTWFKALKRASPTIVLVHGDAVGFPATVGATAGFGEGFRESRTANATITGAYFRSNWTASAEL